MKKMLHAQISKDNEFFISEVARKNHNGNINKAVNTTIENYKDLIGKSITKSEYEELGDFYLRLRKVHNIKTLAEVEQLIIKIKK